MTTSCKVWNILEIILAKCKPEYKPDTRKIHWNWYHPKLKKGVREQRFPWWLRVNNIHIIVACFYILSNPNGDNDDLCMGWKWYEVWLIQMSLSCCAWNQSSILIVWCLLPCDIIWLRRICQYSNNTGKISKNNHDFILLFGTLPKCLKLCCVIIKDNISIIGINTQHDICMIHLGQKANAMKTGETLEEKSWKILAI